jgi:hypothetical protein
MLGPFSIDTYIPAFSGIARALGRHAGADAADAVGLPVRLRLHEPVPRRAGGQLRPPAGGAVGHRGVHLASAGCALSQTIGQLVFFRALQGLSTGAGIVVSRAVIRDMFPPDQAQKVMSQVTIYFGVAPAVAPIIGGWLFVHAGWHAHLLVPHRRRRGAVAANYKLLPETLHATQRQPFNVRNLMRGYWQLGSSPRFLLLALASGVPFNGMFLYVLSAPEFLGDAPAAGADAVLLVLPAHHRRHHGRRLGQRPPGRPHRAQAADPPRLRRDAAGVARERGGQPAVRAAGLVGAAADRRVRLRLGADGAGGDAAGAGPVPRAARHGLVAAGLHRLDGQRRRGRRHRAAGDAFDRRWRWRRC